MELNIGDKSDNGQITIVDKDKLCYLVKSESRGAVGLRTISKVLLEEYIDYFTEHPDSNADDARRYLSGKSEIDKFEYGYTATLTIMAKMVLSKVEGKPLSSDRKPQKAPLQEIFYGAPGTGKSHEIKEKTNNKKVIRTTFHPDSDYSTFVGAYKPTMDAPEKPYSFEELVAKLKETKLSGVTYPCHKFATKYWKSLKGFAPEDIKRLLTACGFTESMNVEISKGIAIGEEIMYKEQGEKILYKFVKQAFLKAYLQAWKLYSEQPDDSEPMFLVIEEINRGNCAQIFGDLFQLLDRADNGFSEYPIDADTDLQRAVKEAFANEEEFKLASPINIDGFFPNYIRNDNTSISKDITEGNVLLLPRNLYIWATMNTSDQSLFPIDSAFKRRWDWKYIPINTEEKEWLIEVKKGVYYKWNSFLKIINEKIGREISAEDKKLGFFFCKATKKQDSKDPEPTIITVDTFVSKVLFYIYNDVFKDYGVENYEFFKDEHKETINFPDYFKSASEYDLDKVATFLNNLKVEVPSIGSTAESDGTAGVLKVTFPDGTIVEGNTSVDVYMKTISKVINEHGLQAVKDAEIKFSGLNIIQDKDWRDDRFPSSSQKQMDGFVLFLHASNEDKKKSLEKLSEKLGLGLTVEMAS